MEMHQSAFSLRFEETDRQQMIEIRHALRKEGVQNMEQNAQQI
jgi:hypothetical protein